MNWYKGRLDPIYIVITQLIKEELKKYDKDTKSQKNLMADIRDTMTMWIKAVEPDEDKKWYQFWK